MPCDLDIRRAKGDDKSMAAFTRMFDGTEFKQGLEIAFCQSGKGKLITKIGGKQVRMFFPWQSAAWTGFCLLACHLESF